MSANPYHGRVHLTRLTPLGPGRVLAFASVAIGAAASPALSIHGVQVLRHGDDVRVLLPVRETDGFAYGVAVDDERLRAAIEATVLAEWARVSGGEAA